MNAMMTRTITLVTALALTATAGAFAAEPTGEELVQAVYDRPQGADQSGVLTMTLVDAKGKERVRTIKQISGTFADGDKKLMVFQSPADVRGTSFMNWSSADADKGDDQWIYLPALKRVKRISSEGRSDAFMGSDFTYDDLGDRHPSEDTHRVTGQETLNGEEYWIVESVPKDPKELYSKTVTWISKTRSIGIKREYYDKRGSLLKTLTVSKVGEVSGILVIMKTEMKNEQKKTRTLMEFNDVSVNTGLSEDAFTERAMTRGL